MAFFEKENDKYLYYLFSKNYKRNVVHIEKIEKFTIHVS